MSQFDAAPSEAPRSSRYNRLTSLSSMMSDPLDAVMPHKEMMGFRRFAKSFWLDVSGRSAKRTTYDASSLGSGDISPNNTLAYVTLDDIKLDPIIANLQNLSPHDKRVFRSHFEPKGRSETYVTHYNELPLSNDGNHAPTTLTRKSRPLTETKAQNVQANISLKYMDAFKNSSSFAPSKRVLQFRSLPSLIGLKGLLGQVVGGPLEKIVILDADKSFQRTDHSHEYGKFLLRNRIVEVWFIKPEQALEFLQYCQRGSFVVNGFHFMPQWAPPHEEYNADNQHFHEPLDDTIAHAVDKHKASRCLAMKCPPISRIGTRVPYANYRHQSYLNGEEHQHKVLYTNIDLDGIKAEFSRFGDICDVSPLISRKVAVSIHYFDISSAISAMTLFQDSSSQLRKKYAGWILAYERDTTDRACLDL